MTLTELSVICGLCFLTGFFVYSAFQLRQSMEELSQRLASFFFLLSIIFLNFLVLAIYEISKTSSIPALSGDLFIWLFQIVLWVSVILTSIYVISVAYGGALWIYDKAKSLFTRRKMSYERF